MEESTAFVTGRGSGQTAGNKRTLFPAHTSSGKPQVYPGLPAGDCPDGVTFCPINNGSHNLTKGNCHIIMNLPLF